MKNFRGVSAGSVEFSAHALLVGGNNVGKSTVCEALDLVLGPERLYRRPVIDEHDFYEGRYYDSDKQPVEIRLDVVLVDLTEEVKRRFHAHLRRWIDRPGSFADEQDGGPEAADAPGVTWALPLVFIGRYDQSEDDFVGDTFFAHPAPDDADKADNGDEGVGNGLRRFTREHKRLCGFVFLRALRTGSRALSLQRGSLLDTILRFGGESAAEMWEGTLARLRELSPGVGDIPQLKAIRSQITERMTKFVNLSGGDKATAFFASDLTREHLREVVSLFVAAEPSKYLGPFQRLGTGAVNMLVFSLLTFIADLKEKTSAIFAMEEPEIALPPHTQRRVTRFVLGEMGQAIVTSHSPYVIEQFEPEQIVILDRDTKGCLKGAPIDPAGFKLKTFKTARRQFAEAILARAVLVVEGATEAAVMSVASSVLEKGSSAQTYSHLDQAGVTVFDAGGDGNVPRFGPLFRSLGKTVFAFYDKPNVPFAADAIEKLKSYKRHWESPEKGIEALLVREMPVAVLRRFIDDVGSRFDYPKHLGGLPEKAGDDGDVQKLARDVLEARKGDAWGYAAILVSTAQNAGELPSTIRTVLGAIHQALMPPVATGPSSTPSVSEPAPPQNGPPDEGQSVTVRSYPSQTAAAWRGSSWGRWEGPPGRPRTTRRRTLASRAC